MTSRAAIYLRTSVDRTGRGDRVEGQRPICHDLAKREGWQVVDEYVDNDTSSIDRKGTSAWARMLADHAAGRIDAVIITDQDRLARGLEDFAVLVSLGLRVLTLSGITDLRTADGVMRGGMMAVWAKAETMRKAERQVRANRDRRDKGVPTSGRVPYGYKWIPMRDRDTRGSIAAYELDGDRAGDVRAIYDAFLAGVPLGAIARDLNTAGKRTLPYKRKGVVVPGVEFRPPTLRRMLMSPYYAALLPVPPEGGWGTYDQATITRAMCTAGEWPAIVTPEEWEEAKARLAHPERKTSPGPTRKWLLSGLAVCGVCREPVRAGGGERGIQSYRCRSMAHFMRRGAPLDDFIERVIVARLSRPDALDLLADRDRPDTDALRAERRRLEVAVRQAGDDEQDGLIDRAERVRLTRRANARIAELDDLLRAGVDTNALAEVVGQDDVAAAWAALPLSRKRAILEALATVVLHSVGQGNRRAMSDEAMARTVTIEWHQ